MEASGYNWHQTTVGRVENGKRPLRLNELVHLAAMFGVSPIRLDRKSTRLNSSHI